MGLTGRRGPDHENPVVGFCIKESHPENNREPWEHFRIVATGSGLCLGQTCMQHLGDGPSERGGRGEAAERRPLELNGARGQWAAGGPEHKNFVGS